MAIYYSSLSGNTESVVEKMVQVAVSQHVLVSCFKIPIFGLLPEIIDADLYVIGCYTDGPGRVPDEVKDWIEEVGYKPQPVAVFGTGDTQFPHYCGAVDKLATFYNSPFHPLKIEQKPFGPQLTLIEEWIKGVIKNVTTKN